MAAAPAAFAGGGGRPNPGAPTPTPTPTLTQTPIQTQIEPVGGSSIKARFMKPGKYSHVTWLGGNKAKY